MSRTYTYTRYFNEEDLNTIAAGFRILETSFLEREPHISKDAAQAIQQRLDILRIAWALLLEPVPGAFE